MSKRTRKLRGAFEIQVSPTAREKVAGFLGGKKDAAVEKIPVKKPTGRAAKQLKVRTAGGQKCTCRKPTLDRHGKCTRCKQKP